MGRNGLSSHHLEGGGTTPIGVFTIGPTMDGVSVSPGVRFGYHQLSCGDWWNEDRQSRSYNHFVHLACGVAPSFTGSSEALWQNVPAYDYFAVIDYNVSPVVPGRGSGIFLHVAKGDPTTGCVSVAKENLLQLLRLLRPSSRPLIDIATALRG